MTREECVDGMQRIIDENQNKILVRLHVGYLIHAVKYLKDQPEIVRCKDCKWWENGLCENDDVARKINDCGCYPDFRTDSGWFCADGERREIDAID